MPSVNLSTPNVEKRACGARAAALLLLLSLPASGLMAQCPDSLATDTPADSLTARLGEAQVRGRRPLVKALPGKLVYDLRQLIADKPVDNAYEALKQLPGVVEQNDVLTLAGQGVSILIDGKGSSLSPAQLRTLLQSLPADRVNRAEVMANAPARYQVRGAVIDLHLRRADGSATWQGEGHAAYTQSHEATFEERATLLHNGTRLAADLLYDHPHGEEYHPRQFEARHHLADGTVWPVDNNEVNRLRGHRHLVRAGADWTPAKGHSLGAVYNGQYATSHYRTQSSGTQTATMQTRQTPWLHNGRADYTAPFGLKAGAEFTFYRAPSRQALASEMDGIHAAFATEGQQLIRNWHAYAGQEHKLKREWSVNYGVVFRSSLDHSRQHYAPLDGNTGSLPDALDSRLRETTWNVYAGFAGRIGPKVSLDASIAAEHYRNPRYDRWDAYPAVNLQYVPTGNHILQISFGSETRYPDYWAMQNTVTYSGGSYCEIQGNPELRPQRAYALSATYVAKGRYVVRLWGNLTRDYLAQQIYLAPDRLVEICRHMNQDFQQQAGLMGQIPVQPARWWTARLTLIGVWMREKNSGYFDLPFDRAVSYGMATLDQTFTLTPALALTVDGMVRSRALQGIMDLPASGNVDLGLRYTFARRNAVLSLFAKDIFETAAISPQARHATQQFTMRQSAYRQIGIALTYRFGGYKEKRRPEADTSRLRK